MPCSCNFYDHQGLQSIKGAANCTSTCLLTRCTYCYVWGHAEPAPSPFPCMATGWESNLAHNSAMCLKHPTKVCCLQVHPAAQLLWELTLVRQLKEQWGMLTCWILVKARRTSGRWRGRMNEWQEARVLTIPQEWDSPPAFVTLLELSQAVSPSPEI